MDERDFLRHLLAVLAYRGGKCLRGAPDTFPGFAGGGKAPVAILAHVGDLLDWSLTLVRGEARWRAAEPGTWEQETVRFHEGLARLDEQLASGAPSQAEGRRLVQGPLVDALTHMGQLAMLRRMAGAPIPGENYYVAEMTIGRVGVDQAAPVKPF